MLSDRNVFVGWGSSPWFSEYAPNGSLVFAAHFASAWYQSYRAFKGPWVGKPRTKPAVTAHTKLGNTAAYVAWNGATAAARKDGSFGNPARP